MLQGGPGGVHSKHLDVFIGNTLTYFNWKSLENLIYGPGAVDHQKSVLVHSTDVVS